MRNEGGGFAASIYGAMPESRIQVTSHSLVRSAGVAHKNMEAPRSTNRAMPEDGISVTSH